MRSHIRKSHISDPRRLSRLMIAACLACIRPVFLGTLALSGTDGEISIVQTGVI